MTDTIKDTIRETFNRRVAIRVYNEQDINRDDMETILNVAWLSPSSIGLEGWRFVVLNRDHIAQLREKLKKVAWGAQTQLNTASHFILLLAKRQVRYDSPLIRDSLVRRGLTDKDAIETRLKTYESFQKTCMDMADNPRALFDWAAKQTYIALGNMMTTAAMIGIDSCPIEGFDYAAVNDILAKEGIIDPKEEGIASMLSLGYRLEDPKHSRFRKERSEVIHWLD